MVGRLHTTPCATVRKKVEIGDFKVCPAVRFYDFQMDKTVFFTGLSET